jgi:hypothetical protein
MLYIRRFIEIIQFVNEILANKRKPALNPAKMVSTEG